MLDKIRDKMPRLRTGKGAKSQVKQFTRQLDAIEKPDGQLTVEVDLPGEDDPDKKVIDPDDYIDEVSRVVGSHIRESYHAGKEEGLMQANNEDRHFKMTMMALFASILNTGVLIMMANHMGLLG